ncbi:MAG: nucleoside deaminase [Kiritimatiellae bacterium]|jgi:tRNA(adenine34) deaminase|nr:nucleoside deaminase [Kiritimatiellia bacterium]
MTKDAFTFSEHEPYMRQAIETACQNLQRPFGALLVDTREGEVLARAVNRSYRNPVAHSELEVIRKASQLSVGDIRWHECTLYVTAEPCAMCMTGILWAGIPRVVFGSYMTTLRDLRYRHIALAAEEVVERATGGLTCRLIGGVLESECDALFAAAIKLEKKSMGGVQS